MVKFLFKKFLTLLSFFSPSNQLIILTYHQVNKSKLGSKYTSLDARVFEKHLKWLKAYFNVLDLPCAISLLEQQKLPKRSVVITIDDGYVDSYTTIFPLMKKYQLPCSFFISTSGIARGYLWEEAINVAVTNLPIEQDSFTFNGKNYCCSTFNERSQSITLLTQYLKYKPVSEREQLVEDIIAQLCNEPIQHVFLKPHQIIEMHNAGMCIGSHTVNHPILSCEEIHIASQEIVEAKSYLEEMIGSEVDFFAYPNGKQGVDFTNTHVNLVKESGYKAALSTNWGTNINPNIFTLERITLKDESMTKFCLKLIMNLFSRKKKRVL